LIPLRDENRSLSTPHITRVFIIINVIVFFFFWFLGNSSFEGAIFDYGMIPAYVVTGERLYTLFTSMFMHGGILHLVGNMLYLYIFGDNIEDAFGHGRYFAFYFICGIAASAMHIVSIATTEEIRIPAIGASGAISGVLGAYLLLYPRARVLTLVLYGWAYVARIPSIFFIGFWFVYQLLLGFLPQSGGVAYWAHIGGFIAGMALALILRRRKGTPRVEKPMLF
jgi:membrane associated rhomboid family serine protease